jgi:hypothetical protein
LLGKNLEPLREPRLRVKGLTWKELWSMNQGTREEKLKVLLTRLLKENRKEKEQRENTREKEQRHTLVSLERRHQQVKKQEQLKKLQVKSFRRVKKLSNRRQPRLPEKKLDLLKRENRLHKKRFRRSKLEGRNLQARNHLQWKRNLRAVRRSLPQNPKKLKKRRQMKEESKLLLKKFKEVNSRTWRHMGSSLPPLMNCRVMTQSQLMTRHLKKQTIRTLVKVS